MDERDGLDIAIIGLSGRFPGAGEVNAFWRNLRDGVESITFFTDEELRKRGVPPESLADPLYVKAGAVLEGVDLFDAAFFGFTPREAAETDPQHRLFLEVAWEAMEDAGYDASNCNEPIGVYAGCGVNTYLLLNLFSSGRFSDMQDISSLQALMNGNNKDSMTTTVSYKLNLRGPGITVQTACSTSLAAVHVACRGLLNHEADMALAGGVWVNLLHEGGYVYQPGAILSPDGHCRAFDADAAGTVIGSGVGVVVLKRLEDALKDGDTIHAVIKGSAMNNDGSAKIGYTAPSVEGQAEVILAAQAFAGVSADTIGYIEAHGTGTTLGDPIEIAALTQAFRESTARRGFCGIGSVKSNVGHLDAAAGVAGLIKTTLSLKHRTLPPSLNFRQPNPQIDFADSPFYVNTVTRDWPAGTAPRRAGVSSFGIGGTNVHVIVEEAPPAPQTSPSRDWQVLTLSARTPLALEAMVHRLRQRLAENDGLPLADIAYTLHTGRKRFAHGAIALCRDTADAITLLETRDTDRFLTREVTAEKPAIAFLFPGQGAQYVDMALDLYRDEPVFRQELDHCLELLGRHLDFELRTLLYPDPDFVLQAEKPAEEADLGKGTARARCAARLEQTEVAQPALFAVEYALARLWMSWGTQPEAMLGHSIGEYVAACLAGVFSLEDALRLVILRGRLLQGMEKGAMLAVMLPEEEMTSYLDGGCSLAAINGPELCVLSGRLEAIEQAEASLGDKGVVTRRLHVSHAFHSPMTEPALPVFAAMVSAIKLNPPGIPFLSNLSGDWITAQEATDPDYWVRHMRGTVRFHGGLSELLSNPRRVLLEVGPGETLTKLAGRNPNLRREHAVISSLPHPDRIKFARQHFYLAVGRLWQSGATIDWASFHAHERRQRVSLPTYPFERQSYWVKSTGRHEMGDGSMKTATDMAKITGPGNRSGRLDATRIDSWLYAPSWRRSDDFVANDAPSCQGGAVLIFMDMHEPGEALAAHFRTLGIEPVTIFPGRSFARQDGRRYEISPGRRQDYDQLLHGLREEGKSIGHVFHLWSLTGENEARSLADSQARNFFSLFYLAQALEDNRALIRSGSKVQMTVVTNQLEDITGTESLRPEKASVTGPCNVIPQEYSWFSCRLIDIELRRGDAAALARVVGQIIAESRADTVSSTVGYRGAHRWIQTFEPIQSQAKTPSCLRQSGVYLITGGLGGIGLTLAEHLARTRKARLVLLGRSAIPAREHWQRLISDPGGPEPVRHKIEKILYLESLGAEVLALQADVAIEAELRSAVTQAWARFGVIHGVIHAAGEVGNGLISAKTEEMVERIFAPKLQGTRALQAVFGDVPLDFLLLCSSLASIAGGLNKVDYAAANAYLDAVARAASRESLFPVISVNWDSWREVGMAADMTMPEGVGIAPGEGVEVFERILSGRMRPQIIVSTFDLDARLSQTQEDLITDSFPHHPDQEQQEKEAKSQYPRPPLGTVFVSPESELEQTIADIWRNLLGVDAVGIHDNLFELGGDSLLGIQLLSRVRSAFGVALRPADFFRLPTVSALAELVEAKLLDEIECA